jgi:D-alanyl-D-alanine carboxypeptidase (penicillin-binding protein 5/6)
MSLHRKPYGATYRRRRLKRRVIYLVAIVFAIGILYSHRKPSPSAATSLPTRATAAPTIKAAPFSTQPSWPVGVSAAAVGVQGYGVIATHGDSAKHPTASLAKVITALAILEKHPLEVGQQGPSIPITAQDVQSVQDYTNLGGSTVAVQAGTPITEHQALEAMLLPSANNIADTTARWAFGSLSKYQAYANTMVARLGLHNTVVGSDASGLNASTQSSASDLVLLGETALQDPVIAQIVAQPETSSLPIAGVQPNYNRSVTQHGYSGIKIGNSDEAGVTLLFSTETTFQGKKVILVGSVLGAQTQFEPQNSAFNMLESAKQTLK